MHFIKMHGAGNDFVILDARSSAIALSPARIARLCNRHCGIGCDQLIVLHPAETANCVHIRIYNPDGSESATCGNATRCVAYLLAQETGQDRVVITTSAGSLPAWRAADGAFTVDMGPPALDWQNIPLAEEADTLHLPIAGDPAAASMGNPHATFFVADLAAVDVAVRGFALEHHALFARGANIGFAEIADGAIRLKVWERGAGLTLACGSGACAALVNAHRRGLAPRAAPVVMDGGTLHIEWRADGHVLMTGPVAVAFHGEVDMSQLSAISHQGRDPLMTEG